LDLQIEIEDYLIRNTAAIFGLEISNEMSDTAILKNAQLPKTL
jgi:hypothetical protein